MKRSDKPRPARSVTIVTQLSLERTSMLEQQCEHWPHPISAVIYIPLVRGKIFSAEDEEWMLAPLEKGVDSMRALYERMSSLQCILDMEVVAEERCSNDLAILYPTNAVRNRALLTAQSDVVLLLDVDFVADLSLVRALEDDAQNAELSATLEQGKALVLPAFEAWDQGDWGRKVALDAVQEGKKYIAQKFMYNVVMGFHMSHYPQGHEKTDFWRCINSTEAYEVDYQLGFEPYILMARKYVPYYDERFRGYYWNKVQHLMHISLQNRFTWVVHPHSFVVHVPHRKPSTKWRTKRSGQKERNHVMFLEALDDMKRDKFVPVTSFPHLCLPPDMQEGVAAVVGNQEQKEALLAMAKVVAPLEEEIWEAQLGAKKKRGKSKSTNGAPAVKGSETASQLERGELSRIERPVNHAVAEGKAKAKKAKEELAAAEMLQDIEQLRAAKERPAEDSAMLADDTAADEEDVAKEIMDGVEDGVQDFGKNDGEEVEEAYEDIPSASLETEADEATVVRRNKGRLSPKGSARAEQKQQSAEDTAEDEDEDIEQVSGDTSSNSLEAGGAHEGKVPPGVVEDVKPAMKKKAVGATASSESRTVEDDEWALPASR